MYANTKDGGKFMSVVIIGGHERMTVQYEEICREYGYDAKVFSKKTGSFKKSIGSPDLMILFTNTTSHKMVISAVSEAKKMGIPIKRTHSSSAFALKTVLSGKDKFA